MVSLATRPLEERVKIGFMDDPKKLVLDDGNKKWYSEELWLIKIPQHRKRLSDLLNDSEIFLEYENKIGDLITINKNAILFVLLNFTKTIDKMNYNSSMLEIELKRWVRFKWYINTEWRVNYRQSLEKRWFIPVDYKHWELFNTIIINRNNIMRIIEHKED